MYNLVTKTIELSSGQIITIETGKLAKQANGSVVVRSGKTMILATVVSAKDAKEDVDFMPLSVEYREKFSAIGRFPGGFMKRESKPSDNEVLISRLVDRALRPLFPENFHAETFVTIDLISADRDFMPDALAGLAASAALAVSDVPFLSPISEVRVSRVDGNFIVNPTFTENERADIEILVGATYDNILMVEGEMAEVSEYDMLEAIKIAHDAIKVQCMAQIELMKEIGKTKREYCHETNDEELRNLVMEQTYQKVYDFAKSCRPKQERAEGFAKIKEDFIATLPKNENGEVDANAKKWVNRYYHHVEWQAMRDMILNEGIRLDGRKTDQIRPIWCEVDYLPAAHGSAIFTRGETQSLTTVTLGSKLDEKIIDEVLTRGKDKFLLHYNFPPFATGEARPIRNISRREVGHGNLAHRALKRMLPGPDQNPYSIRVVSDILESNGSSSMATVCAGTLALMDAGVKIIRPVSGIAMGLITDGTGRFAVLSDILGDEDHLGDMDFKVTGTTKGITACQMDIKVDGLSYEILAKALAQANEGRLFILAKLLETLPEVRPEYKPHAPQIERIIISKEVIGALIGPGGKVIQQIQADTNTVIVVEETNDGKAVVEISANNKDNIDAAIMRVRGITDQPEVGSRYKGKVKSIVEFGAFVEILPGKEGLLHISEIDHRRIQNVKDVLSEGDMVEVELIEVDKKTNKLRLSRKSLIPNPNPPRERSEHPKTEMTVKRREN